MTFFDALFGQTKGQIEIRPIRPDQGPLPRKFCDSTRQAEIVAEELDRKANVYFGVASRDGEGGSKENLVDVQAVWIDVDYDDPEEDRLILAAQMDQFELQPSIVVATGGGVHCYWLLAEPFEFETPNDLGLFENILKGLAATFNSDRSTTDASRILRVPGTTNLPDAKKRAKGRTEARCELKLLKPERVYGLELFQALHDLGEQSRTALGSRGRREMSETKRKAGAESINVPAAVRSVLETNEKALARFKGDATGLAEPGRDAPSDSSIDLSLANLLASHRTLTHADVSETLRASRDYRGAKHKHEAYYGLTVDKAWHEARRGVGASVDPVQERGTWLRMQTRGAIEGYDGLSLVELKPGEALTDFDTDRWTSSVRELDDGMSGGFYGMTVVSGKAGGGKSILALASAIEAAEAGWTVMYFNTELDDRQMNNRLRRHGISNEAFDRFAVMRVGFGVMVEDMAEWLCSRLDDETKAVLVVVDSSTTFARLAGVRHEDKGTLTELARLVMWTATLRQRTQGVISFMLVSELNSQGVEYGREIQHLADVVLRVEKTDEADTVELNCIKGREGGEKDYGQFFRDWRRGRLEAKIIADIRASEDEYEEGLL